MAPATTAAPPTISSSVTPGCAPSPIVPAPQAAALRALLDRAHLGLALEAGPVLPVQVHELRRDAERVGLRLRLQDGPAADDLFALGKGAVGHLDLALGQPDAGAVLARAKAARADQRTVLGAPLDEPAHRFHQGRRRRRVAIRFRAADECEVFHGSSSSGLDHATNKARPERHAARIFLRPTMPASQATKAERFLALHARTGAFVIP